MNNAASLATEPPITAQDPSTADAPAAVAAAAEVEPTFVPTERDGVFYESSAFFPMPVLIAVSESADGQLNVAPYSLCFPQPEAGECMLMLISKRASNTARNVEATGKVSLCFLPDDQEILDQCVALARPNPSVEKMRLSKFTVMHRDGHPMVAEAEQVFVCSLRELTKSDNGKEHRMLLHVDNILLRPRWQRALKRGWGAPRLAVEFGFRGRSARWLSRPRVKFGGPALRPTFEMDVNMSVAEVEESLQRALDAEKSGVQGFVRTMRAQINIPAEESHFWSPELEIRIEEEGERTKLKGRVGPHPQVWTMLMLLHLAVAILGIFGGFIGASQWMIGQSAWALLAIPGALVTHAFLLGAAFVGQGLGADHVFRLREFVHEALTH